MSAATTQTLNPLTLPLHGHRLIEASAGTGKTWTIAALYLRLLLGHGDEQSAHKEPLSVDQILVVTFTEAATEELRDRVRRRIHEAREAFLGGETSDPFLQDLLNALEDHPRQAERLLHAEQQMDEAAIFTIHGFCQRMLKQHAFESGTLFTSELMEDQSELISDTVADFWRRTMYPLNLELTNLARSLWKNPAKLESDISRWLNIHDLQLINHDIPDSLAEIEQQIEEIRAVKALWRDSQEQIQDLLSVVLKKSSKPWKRLSEMHQFAQSSNLEPLLTKSEENSWYCYTPATLEANCSKGQIPPDMEVFRRIEQLCKKPSLEKTFKSFILRDALNDVGSRLIQRRLDMRKMSFDDLLVQLDNALRKPGGEILADHIRTMFRVALIDEFQDTDAIQYRIFSNLYPVASSESAGQDDLFTSDSGREHGLFLIGDPKQAIYAFRGADIFTYIHAKHKISDHYTLPINWRSSSSMIAATNHLFAQAESAFIYDNDIPFLPVRASSKADQRGLFIDSHPVKALQIWCANDGGNIGRGDYTKTMTEATADEIKRLLTLAQSDRCKVGGSEHKTLTPNQIAVLVRTGHQAQQVKQALQERNIASVYMSDRSSVFDSQEALDISRLLAACLEPTNERYLRAALATPLLAKDAESLDELNNNELHWEQAIEEFNDYHQQWLNRGVLPMLRLLITRRKLAENLLTAPNGERQLTNVLHIGELLAAAAKEKETPHALLRWLRERITSPDTNAKDQQLHLESERNLVQIVTIHKSKGLQYGVVFIPFACTWKKSEQAIFHDENQQVVADLLGSEETLAKADRERIAEDLRLLYVALTRSVHACYLGVGSVKERPSVKKPEETDLHKTALGHLLRPNDAINTSDFYQALEKLTEECPSIELSALPDVDQEPYQPVTSEHTTLSARQFTSSIANNWWLTSYSALSRHASHAAGHNTQPVLSPDASHEIPGLDLEVHGQQKQPQGIERPAYSSLLDFPKGAQPGTFLHEIFERIAFENPDAATIETMIAEQLLVHGFDEQWLSVLKTMVNDVIHTPLNDSGLALSALKSGDYMAELEFNLPLGLLKAHDLNNLLRQYDPLSQKAGDLVFQNVQGMLKGFIDLTFTHDGRWYVLDWKSNWLGETTAAYTRQAMAEGMIAHRYDLQYLIYVLALHRMLKSRLPDYDYDTHMGGAFYIFLRGVRGQDPLEMGGDPNSDPDGDQQTGIYYHRPQQELIEAMDRLFQGAAQNKENTPC